MASDDSNDYGFWIFLLALCMFLGPCSGVENNENEIDDLKERLNSLQQQVEELEKK